MKNPARFPWRGLRWVVVATYSPWGLTAQVPLALGSLTAVFGMGTGVAFPLTPPQIIGMVACIDSNGRLREEDIDFDLMRWGESCVLKASRAISITWLNTLRRLHL